MKSLYVVIIIIIISSCNYRSHSDNQTIKENFNNEKSYMSDTLNLEDKIKKAPVSNLPIGMNNLEDLTLYDCVEDVNINSYLNPSIYKTPIVYPIDSINKYKLNELVTSWSPTLNFYEWSSPISIDSYFSKKFILPNNANLLLYMVIKKYDEAWFYYWYLVLFSNEEINDILQIGGLSVHDSCYNYAFFNISDDYKITIKYYSYCEEGSDNSDKAIPIKSQIYSINYEVDKFDLEMDI